MHGNFNTPALYHVIREQKFSRDGYIHTIAYAIAYTSSSCPSLPLFLFLCFLRNERGLPLPSSAGFNFAVATNQGWEGEAYLTVQWRTETSTGNLTRCYGLVRDRVEEYRLREGLGRGQVFFNTDLVAHTSGTYASKVCPKALGGLGVESTRWRVGFGARLHGG